ncbi:MAG: Uma2 family endonuclease [Panacagrimonas sp.]
MRAALKLPIAVEDYLEGEKVSPVKHEYVDGQVYAMTGTMLRHARAVANLWKALDRRRGTRACEAVMNDLKVRVESFNAYYYPDVVLTCHPQDPQTYVIDSPCLIAEVLSPSTEGVDRREKLAAYRTLPTLKEYVLVNPAELAVEVWRRTPAGWVHEELETGDSLRVDCLDASIPLTEIYPD